MRYFGWFPKNERGDALLSTLILSAVGLAVMVGLGSSMISLVKMQRGAVLAGDRVDVREQIRSGLSFRNTCLGALGGQSIAPGSGNSTPITLNMFMSGQTRVLAPGAEAALGLTVTKLTFDQTAAPTASSSIDPTGSTLPLMSGTILTGKIVINLKKTNASLFAPQYSPDEIPVTVAVNAGGSVIACVTESSDNSTCVQMNNAWFPLNPIGSQCQRKEQCDLGGGYCNAPVAKGGFVNPATSAMSCPTGYKARQKGVVTYATACGKSCVNNETFPVVECAKCRGLGGDLMPDVPVPPATSSMFGSPTGSAIDNQQTALENFFNALGYPL